MKTKISQIMTKIKIANSFQGSDHLIFMEGGVGARGGGGGGRGVDYNGPGFFLLPELNPVFFIFV